MKYHDIPPLSRAEVEEIVARDDPETLARAVLSACLHAEDATWAGSLCERLAGHRDAAVRGNAILGLGHLARIHRHLSPASARALIAAALADPSAYVRGQADAAADDVEQFLGWVSRQPDHLG